MTSTNETGHSVNVANFEKLIAKCIGFGADYKPSNPRITIEALTQYQATIGTAVKNVTTLKNALDKAIDERKVLYDPVRDLSLRIVDALRSAEAPDGTIKMADSVNAKIQGRRKSEIIEIDPTKSESEQSKSISASQTGFDQTMNNFFKLIDIVKNEPLYKPNEEELTVTALETLYTSVINKNTAMIKAAQDWHQAIIDRDKAMYTGKNLITAIAKLVKKYVKSAFKTSSPEYKAVVAIKFTKGR